MSEKISIVEPILALVAVFIVMAGVFWGLRRLQEKRNIFGDRSIQVIEAASVGPRERVVVISIDNKRYALGVTAQSINVISELGDVDDLKQSEINQLVKKDFKASLIESVKQRVSGQ